jgi:hypothetical protein
VPNPTLQWHGVTAPGADQRLLLRIGDCSWQEIPHGHTWGAPGYPRLIAEALTRIGISLRFANHHSGLAGDLPDPDALARTCQGSRPDAIVVQLGSYYAGRGLVSGENFEPHELRTWFNWVSGPVGGALHRSISRPLLKRRGHHRVPAASELDAGTHLEAFLSGLHESYSGTPVAFIPPHMTHVDASVDPARLVDAANVLIAGARAADATVIDIRPEIAAAAAGGSLLFGANGYDLRRPGHAIVAEKVLAWLQAEWRPRHLAGVG